MLTALLHTAGQYTEANVKMAEANQEFVMGFISITPAKWPWGPGAPGLPPTPPAFSMPLDTLAPLLPLCLSLIYVLMNVLF